TTDSSGNALTGPGSSAMYAYRAGSGSGPAPISIDDYRLRDLSGPQPPVSNRAPVATFTASAAGLDLAVDGSASADPDGTIETFAWDFGDGATASGETADHTYAAAGTYTITLTVTDDDGATDTTTSTQVVTEETLA